MTSHDDLRPVEPAAPGVRPGDDADLQQILRAVAASWTMPPVRLDRPSWRDRVRSPRARRLATLRVAGSRIGRAAAAAVTLSVGAAMLGVLLTRPAGPAANQSASPTGRGATASPAAQPSQLPKLLIDGALPTPTQLVVSVDDGFAMVDLATGTIGRAFAAGQYGTVVRREPGGSIYCLCLGGDSYGSGSFTHMTVTWNRYDDAGAVLDSALIGEYTGAPDPRDVGNLEQSQHVALRVSYGSDPAIAFVGWSAHAHPVWKSGVVVISVADGHVIQRLDLPDRTDGADLVRFGSDAPRVVGSLGAGHLAIARPWYQWSPPTGPNPSFRTGADTFDATTDGQTLSTFVPLAAASDCADAVTGAGPRADGGFWLACTSYQSGTTIVRRVDASGAVLGDTRISGQGDLGGDATATAATSPDGSSLYLWSPTRSTLTRVDLASGETREGKGAVAAAAGPLLALGQWLTPTVQAKVLLSAGLALSPDGTRAYALGIDPNGGGGGGPISSGVFVFDTETMAQVGHWSSTADLVSIAVSADGAFVYVAGSPEFNGNGTVTLQSASISVFDASTGAVRLIAGQLGTGFLVLPSTTVR
ncbi:MAG: hypothetical protein EPO00_08240 [Chloroflexota bacterium]|nr:MAG: hypothetical protein EPO00_08240 [Chloroflexota bacterium]